MRIPDVQRVEWADIRKVTLAVNPALAAAIDLINPADRAPIYKASYGFGEAMIDSTGLRVPFKGTYLKVTDLRIPADIREDLGYTRLPAMIGLNKTTEMFVELNERTFPIHLFDPGTLFGAWETLEEEALIYHHNVWQVVAGARSLFLVPKAADYLGHSRMQRALNLHDAYLVNNPFDQGKVFAEIARAPLLHCDWQADFIIFAKDWFDLTDPRKAGFHAAVLKQGWENTVHLRNHMTFELIWQLLAQAQVHTRLKPNAYVIDSVKHIINIAARASLGFAPVAAGDETSLPLHLIQKAFLEYYNLKYYIPTILAPAYLQVNRPVYYSFLLPTLLSLSPQFSFRNTLENERNIKDLLERFTHEVIEYYPKYRDLLRRQMKFEFFHFEADANQNIHLSSQLPQFDAAFLQNSGDAERTFCENGPFVRACVQISKNPAETS
jgi:hypothetical protein